MSVSKKRKISDESRVFQEKWSNIYFFIQIKKKAICLICQESIAAMKEYNLKRHYNTKHAAKYDMIQGQLRIDKLALLMKNIQCQSSSIKKCHKDSEASVKASYIIAQKIAAKLKPFTDGEFISVWRPLLKFYVKNDFTYLTDITLHLNELNLRLQRQNQLIHNLFYHIKSFENKLLLWEIQLRKNNTTHFPCLSKYNVTSTEKYAVAISDLKIQFDSRFLDFKANENFFNLFSIPFSLSVEDVPENIQY
jgi:hypothetical protein